MGNCYSNLLNFTPHQNAWSVHVVVAWHTLHVVLLWEISTTVTQVVLLMEEGDALVSWEDLMWGGGIKAVLANQALCWGWTRMVQSAAESGTVQCGLLSQSLHATCRSWGWLDKRKSLQRNCGVGFLCSGFLHYFQFHRKGFCERFPNERCYIFVIILLVKVEKTAWYLRCLWCINTSKPAKSSAFFLAVSVTSVR